MIFARTLFLRLVIAGGGLALAAACTNSGVQGTSLFKAFQGVESATPLSPTAIRLAWSLDSNYQSYRVYQDSSLSPIATEQFANRTVSSLLPGTSYQFEVTGVRVGGSEEVLKKKIEIATYTSFEGLKAGGVTVKSPTEVNLAWNMNASTAVYKIYARKSTETFDLAKPVGTVTNNNQYAVSGLVSGSSYCFYIQANYLDNTFEPAATATADVNALAPCVQLTSQIPDLPSVSVSSMAIGQFPWFWAANGANTYKIDVFDLASDTRVASRTGNGTFRSFVKLEPGKYNYYASVSNGVGVANVPVTIDGKEDQTGSSVRALSALDANALVKPALVNDGKGQQQLGKTLASGDFNCDGLTDVAVSLPASTIVSSTNHYKETGGVVIYYSYRSAGPCFDSGGNPVICPAELITSPEPTTNAVYPNPQLVSYPPTADLMRIGFSLAAGNFNGDCYERDSGNLRGGSCNALFASETDLAKLPSIKSCDDLAIGLETGEFDVLYGNPAGGLISGSGANSAGLNEFTCESTSNTCRVGRFTPATGYSGGRGSFPRAMVAGDFNNDGFDELAVAADTTATPAKTDILLFRGSAQGLYPQGASGSHATITDATTGIATLGALVWTGDVDEFGTSLGILPDSRKCVNGTPGGAIYRPTQPSIRKGYDLTKCDDLVIGAPGRKYSVQPTLDRGSIFSCKGTQGDVADKQRISSWSCAEHYPTELNGTAARYGSTIHGARNFNGYPVNNIKSNPNSPSSEVPEVAGALFVGAPYAPVSYSGSTISEAGKVYGYYVTPLATDYFSGGIQGILGSGGHTVVAQNSLACNRLNTDRQTGSLRHCENQALYMWPPETSAHFGSNIGSLLVNDVQAPTESSARWLAVSAPLKNASGPGGTTIANAGSIYLFRPDVSNFGSEGATPILAAQRSVGQETNGSCTVNCTWYSGGASPYGPSLIVPENLTPSAQFGSGGIVGGDFNDDGYGDVIASAPYLDQPTPRNGAAYLFLAENGFSPTVTTPDFTMNLNVALEGNYEFQELRSVGDINNDGYDDAVTHISANGTWYVVIYYGSAQGLVKSPAPSATATGNLPLLLGLASDSGFGKFVFPAGDVNGDSYADILMIGDQASYIYYGSSTGLVTTPGPAIAPIGKGPLQFARNLNNPNYLTFSGESTGNWAGDGANLNSSMYNSSAEAVTVGDFNKDGYSDIALRLYTNASPPVASANLNFGNNQNGRVLIIYGSLNGPQVNRLTGGIRYTNGGLPDDVVVEDPCTATAPITCKVQMLGPPHSSATRSMGFALTTVKVGGKSTHPQYDRLAVSEPGFNSSMGAVYFFEGSAKGVKAEVLQKLIPKPVANGGLSGQLFGVQLLSPGDINGDDYLDFIVATAHATTTQAYVFYGANLGASIGLFGASDISATDYWTGTGNLAVNAQNAVGGSPLPQILRPTTIASGENFAWGMAAMGDFNNDGYADVAFNVPNGDSTISGVVTDSGFGVMYFGSLTGLQSQNVVMSPFPRCYRGSSPLCEPYQLLLPGAVTSENSYFGPPSPGDFDGNGFLDLPIGAVGRDLYTTGKRTATSAGIVYVLY